MDCKVTDVNECFPLFSFRANSLFTNLFELQVQPSSGQVLFRKKTGGSYSTLATITQAMSVNDVVHLEAITSGSTVEVRVWKNAETKPVTASATDTSGSHSTQTRIFLGLVGGNAAASRTVEWQIITLASVDIGGVLNNAGTVYAALPNEIPYQLTNFPADGLASSGKRKGVYFRKKLPTVESKQKEIKRLKFELIKQIL
jgi:hypothetical protein